MDRDCARFRAVCELSAGGRKPAGTTPARVNGGAGDGVCRNALFDSLFPAEAGARLAIGDELRALCAGPKEADWLVTRMRRLYNRWPGPLEMRRVYCSKYLPWDAVLPIGTSEVYKDGIPSERETDAARQIASPEAKLRADSRKYYAIENPKIEAAVAFAAARMPKMPKTPVPDRLSRKLLEVITAPQDRPELPASTPQVITQVDVDREVQKLRANRAKSG